MQTTIFINQRDVQEKLYTRNTLRTRSAPRDTIITVNAFKQIADIIATKLKGLFNKRIEGTCPEILKTKKKLQFTSERGIKKK